MKNFNYFPKSMRFLIGLALSFVLTLPTFANSHSAQATATASQATATVTAHPDDQLAEAVIVGKQTTNNPVINQATAPISQALQNFGKTQNQAQAASENQTPTNLPQSTAKTVGADELTLTSPVMDYAQILTSSEKQQLENQLYKIYQDKLAQVALVIVPTTDGVAIFDYAISVANRFGLGNKQADDGVLIVVAINDRKLEIVTGYGVEGVLPDASLHRIIREDITPSFKTGAYAQGLSAGIARIDERLRADPEVLAKADKQAETQENPVDIMGLFVPAVIVGLFLTTILGRFLGASITAGGFGFFALTMGVGLFGVAVGSLILWLFLLIFARTGVVLPTGSGGFGGGSGGFGGGGFGSGGGGFSGGGGSFGGGGAGGSW